MIKDIYTIKGIQHKYRDVRHKYIAMMRQLEHRASAIEGYMPSDQYNIVKDEDGLVSFIDDLNEFIDCIYEHHFEFQWLDENTEWHDFRDKDNPHYAKKNKITHYQHESEVDKMIQSEDEVKTAYIPPSRCDVCDD